MNSIIVASIHNHSLGSVVSVPTLEEGYELVKKLSAEKLGRELTEEEKDDVDVNSEFYHDQDADNVWCYSVGIVDE